MSSSSVFPTGAIEPYKYYYAFYSVSRQNPYEIQLFLYDNNRNLIEEKTQTFTTITAIELLKRISTNGTNSLTIGYNQSTNETAFDIDIAATRIFKATLKPRHQDLIMSQINSTTTNIYSDAINYYTISHDGSQYVIQQNGIPVSNNELNPFHGLTVFDYTTLTTNKQIFSFDVSGAGTLPTINVEGIIGESNTYQTFNIDRDTPTIRMYSTYSSTPLGVIYNTIRSNIVKSFTVTVSNEVFFINGVSQPKLFLTESGEYLFIQTSPDNIGYDISFSTEYDETTPYTTDVTVYGIPGDGAQGFTIINITTNTTLYYFSSSKSNMGNMITNNTIDITYNVQVKTNVLGESVYAFYDTEEDKYIKQPILPIDFDSVYQRVYKFDTSHTSNVGEILTFGFESDIDSVTTTAFDISYVTYSLENPGTTSACTILDLRNFFVPNQIFYYVDFTGEAPHYYTFTASDGTLGIPYLQKGTTYRFHYVGTNTNPFMIGNAYRENNLFPVITNGTSIYEVNGTYGYNSLNQGEYIIFTIPIVFPYTSLEYFSATDSNINYNIDFKSLKTLTVTVSNDTFYINDILRPKLFFKESGNYIFNQTSEDNAGYDIVFSTDLDGTSVYTTNVEKYGTAGDGILAYTIIYLNMNTTLYYSSISNSSMGNTIMTNTIDVTHSIIVESNMVGEKVYAFYDTGENTHIKQPILPIDFNSDYKKVYYFDTSHISNAGEVLTFGFETDIDSDSTTAFDISYVTHSLESPGTSNSFVILDLRNYSI